MKIKNTLALLVILFLLSPKLVFAAWWNPMTWDWLMNIFASSKTVQVDPPSEVSNQSTNESDSNDGYYVDHSYDANYNEKSSTTITAIPNTSMVSSDGPKVPIVQTTNSKSPLIITDVVDQDASLAISQFVSGDNISITGKNIMLSDPLYTGKVYVDSNYSDFTEGYRNEIHVKSPKATVGEHGLYVVGKDGRKSNEIKVYVVDRVAKTQLPPSVTVKLNGSENPGTVEYNSLNTISWQSASVLKFCEAGGFSMPRLVGGLWTDQMSLERSGSDKVYARNSDGKYYADMEASVICSTGNLTTIVGKVYFKVSPPSTSNPLVQEAALSGFSDPRKTFINSVKLDDSDLSNEFLQGKMLTIKAKNLKTRTANHVFIDSVEVPVVGGATTDEGVALSVMVVIPITVSGGNHNLYIENEGGKSNSVPIKIVSVGLANTEMNIVSALDKSSGKSGFEFTVGGRVILRGHDFPTSGSVSIDLPGQPYGQMGSGFITTFDQQTSEQVIEFSVGSDVSPGQYQMRIIGTDGRTSKPIAVRIN